MHLNAQVRTQVNKPNVDLNYVLRRSARINTEIERRRSLGRKKEGKELMKRINHVRICVGGVYVCMSECFPWVFCPERSASQEGMQQRVLCNSSCTP